MDKIIEQSRQELLIELDRRVEDGIIEKSNADLLKKLIQNAETLTEGTKERDALKTLFSGNRGNNTFKFFDCIGNHSVKSHFGYSFPAKVVPLLVCRTAIYEKER